jgi:hypothetical protein
VLLRHRIPRHVDRLDRAEWEESCSYRVLFQFERDAANVDSEKEMRIRQIDLIKLLYGGGRVEISDLISKIIIKRTEFSEVWKRQDSTFNLKVVLNGIIMERKILKYRLGIDFCFFTNWLFG